MSTATRATGNRSLTAWSLGPLATVPSYQKQSDACAPTAQGRLESHGVYTCVSKSAYDLAGAGEQRIAAGIFLSFYAMHLYAALASGQAGRRG